MTQLVYRHNRQHGFDEVLALRYNTNPHPAKRVREWDGSPHAPNHVRSFVEAQHVPILEQVALDDTTELLRVDDDAPIRSDETRSALWVSPLAIEALVARDITPERALKIGSGGLCAAEWAFCIIKPDAKQWRMERDIVERITSDKQLRVVDYLHNRTLELANLDDIWPAPDPDDNSDHAPSPWWGATVDYMTSGPVDLLIVQGSDASRHMKDLKAELRVERYGHAYQNDEGLPYSERVKSVIHTSDCDTELMTNALGFWPCDELNTLVQSGLRRTTK